MKQLFDVAIIGGGINGCGVAADAALRGLSVVLIEKDDLASKTSSNSSKLIHGGLRYLEHYDLSLVKKALNERQKLLELAPHLVYPVPFVIPEHKSMRPMWLLRLGLFLYDHLGRTNQLPHSKLINRLKQPLYFNPLKSNFNKGLLYYDCATDDARLTITNARQAANYGAIIMPQTSLIHAEVVNHQWRLTLQSHAKLSIIAKTVINTAGPWVTDINKLLNIPLQHSMTLVKGSHLVVPRLYEGEQAYLLQHQDKRIIFAIPYHDYTMVGTTDVDFLGDPNEIHIDQAEIDYLCSLIRLYFNQSIHDKDIITTWSGVRPLLSVSGKNPSNLSRDYTTHHTQTPAPAVTVYGGKITTYRQLAVEAIDHLRTIFPDLPYSKTDITPLPGATFNGMNFTAYKVDAQQKYSWLDEMTKHRYLNIYGTQMEIILAGCKTMADLGVQFASTLYQVEIDYLLQNEWANSLEDILWRRTKLGLAIDVQGRENLATYLSNKQDTRLML